MHNSPFGDVKIWGSADGVGTVRWQDPAHGSSHLDRNFANPGLQQEPLVSNNKLVKIKHQRVQFRQRKLIL